MDGLLFADIAAARADRPEDHVFGMQGRAEPSAGWRPLSITALDGNSEEELQRRVISAVAPRWRCCKRRMPTTRDSRLVGNQEPKEYPYTGSPLGSERSCFARFLPGMPLAPAVIQPRRPASPHAISRRRFRSLHHKRPSRRGWMPGVGDHSRLRPG